MTELAYSRARVLKNTFTQVVTLGLTTATFAAAQIIVARTLGPQGLGAFSPAWQLAVTLSLVALLGLDQRLIRELNRGGGGEEIGSTFALGTILGLVAGALAAAVPWLAGAPTDVAQAFAAAGAFIAVSAPALIIRSSFHAKERMELETVTAVIENVSSVVAMVGALRLGLGAAGAIAGLAVGRTAGLASSIVLARRLWPDARIHFPAVSWLSIVRTSVPLGISFAFTAMVIRFDIVVVGALRTADEAGIYGAAAVVTFAVPMIVNALTRSLFPVLSRAGDLAHPELGDVFRKTWCVLIVTGLGAAALISTIARPAMTFVYGDGFAASAAVLIALAWLLPIRFLNSLGAATLNATVWKTHQTRALAMTVAGNLVANLILVPLFGYWGAVYAAFATEAVLLVVLGFGLRAVRPPVIGPVVQGAAVATAVAVVAAATPGSVILRGATGTITFMVGAVIVRAIGAAARPIAPASTAAHGS